MMLLPFNTSTFSNILNADDRAAQRKALVAPFQDLFDANHENVLQFTENFTQRCQETGVMADFDYIVQENQPPSDVDLTDKTSVAAWQTDPRRFTIKNLLIDSSEATFDNVKAARDTIRNNLTTLSNAPCPKKQPKAAQQLVSFQNRQWIYTLLQNTWTPHMKAIMQKYHEVHGQDGVVLWYCFLHHFAGTSTENIIEAYSQLSESKVKLSLYQGNVHKFTNAIRVPLRRLIKANETPSIHHFLYVLHGCLDAPNEEFRAFIYNKETDFRNNGPTRSLSLLDLLDQLDTEYTRICNLGRWNRQENPQVLALIANLNSLQANYSNLQKECVSLRSLVTSKDKPQPSTSNKPPKWTPGQPEVKELNGTIWKWCAKCFNGAWTKTHVTSEHVRGRGRQSIHKTPQDTNNGNSNAPIPQANLSTTSDITPAPTYSEALQANLSTENTFELDFM
jgi:hypothetical protein